MKRTVRVCKAFAALAIAAVTLCTAPQAQAASITTLFNTNNSGTAGGGVYFDIVVGANPIEITGFDVNTTAVAGTPIPFRAWTLVGTNVGNQANPGAWTFATDGAGVSAGSNGATSIALNGTISLNAGTSYGIALSLSHATGAVPSASHAYSGTGASPLPGALQYSNADLTMNLGSATNVLFAGAPFTPRIWNGTIYYNVVPAPGVAALMGLAGLMVSPRRRRA